MTYHYTTKEEREDERFQALRNEYANEIRQLFNDGWRGQKGLRLPAVYTDTASRFRRDVIRYEVPFPNAVFECLSNDSCMALLMDAADPATLSPALYLEGLREACVEQYLKDNLDDIVRCAWEARNEE
jgi:AcrR family transcriptional regulator